MARSLPLVLIVAGGCCLNTAGEGRSQGEGSSGTGGADGGAELDGPWGIAVDGSGNVYVSDLGSNRIRKIDPAGTVSTLNPNGQLGFRDGPLASAEFEFPRGLAMDAAGNLYIADIGNNAVRVLRP